MNTETQIPENETIAQKAYRLLSPIPAEQWHMNTYTDEINACCAKGHLNRLSALDPSDYSRNNCIRGWGNNRNLSGAIKEFFKKQYNVEESFDLLVAVNDGDSGITVYTEETPKERVLHLLTDMIAEGF
jgi:hypothetical protein